MWKKERKEKIVLFLVILGKGTDYFSHCELASMKVLFGSLVEYITKNKLGQFTFMVTFFNQIYNDLFYRQI